MKLLMDTHIVIWALTDDRRLSENARTMIADEKNIVFYSAASLWEIVIKNMKAPEKCPYDEKSVEELCRESGFQLLDIKVPHIHGIRELKVKEGRVLQNQDPFDRILIAQAREEKMKLLSHDANFDNYDEKCICMV